MTQIVGTIEDSGGVGLTGILRVSLDSLMVDGSSTPDALLTGEPRDFAIANGVVNIDLVESQTKNLTYHIQFLTSTSSTSYYFANGGLYTGPTHYHTDSQWYTGAVHTTNSELLFPQVESRSTVLLDFHAVVPSINSVGFSALVPTGIATDILDTSLRRLAEILVTNVDYVETLRGGPRWKGDYNTATYYQQADTVAYAGSGWFYNNPNPAAGQTPSEANTAYWQLVSRKGDPGGTGGNDVVYNAIGWNGATWAPTANAVRDIIELLARANDAALDWEPDGDDSSHWQ
ncbi:MAG: hypothetical protein HC781_01580 [Leptolyngbyaceae cyanobacterium CSU_1_4]|nr:hypothetical protein [Leptolyngbyaceae cyanobacterium CSU_1_4]